MLRQCLTKKGIWQLQVLKLNKYAEHSLGQYIREKGYSQAFISHYLLPMCAAVWSVPNAQVPMHTYQHSSEW